MSIAVVADQGSHLLIARGDRFAVVERRNNRFYNCHGGNRGNMPVTDVAAVGDILDEGDWVSEDAARTQFDEVVDRGQQLAERM